MRNSRNLRNLRDISEGTPFQVGVSRFTSIEFKGHGHYFRLVLEESWYATSELARYVDLQDLTPKIKELVVESRA